MSASRFAVSLHPQTLETSRPVRPELFIGASYPHWVQLREALAAGLPPYPSLPLRQAALQDYARVHSPAYLSALEQMAAGETPSPCPA